MKAAASILLFAFATAVLADSALLGPDQPVPGKGPPRMDIVPQVCMDLLTVSLPEDKALPLLPALRDPSTIAEAQARLLELIARKEATFIGWPQVTTLSGNRCVMENIVEQTYPIEVQAIPKVFEKAKSPPEGAFINDPGAQSQFETRNTGTVLEFEPVVAEDMKSVKVQLAPQLVRLIREKEFPIGTNQKGEKSTVSQLIFDSHRVNTNIILRDGERRLLYVGKSVEPGSPVILFIVGAKIIPAVSSK